MKKVFMSTLMLLVAVMMSAATYSWEKVVTVTLTDGNNDTYSSRFGAAPELTDAASWGAVSANLTGATVRAYTTLGGVDYEQLYLNSIENLPLTIKTYESANLNITLTALYGEIKLYDNGNLVLTVAKGGTETDTYECTVATGATIEGRFVINYVPAPQYAAEVTTNAYGLATFSFDQPLAPVEAGVKLYKGAINGNYLDLDQVADYKANQGVVVYGEANTTYHFEVINGATADFEGNELLAASAWQYPHAGTAYVLSGSSLYIYEGENMKPNKAFLLLQANNAPRRISFRFNGTTAFENVEMNEAKAVKFMEDGKVFIKRGDAIYNLQGQLVK